MTPKFQCRTASTWSRHREYVSIGECEQTRSGGGIVSRLLFLHDLSLGSDYLPFSRVSIWNRAQMDHGRDVVGGWCWLYCYYVVISCIIILCFLFHCIVKGSMYTFERPLSRLLHKLPSTLLWHIMYRRDILTLFLPFDLKLVDVIYISDVWILDSVWFFEFMSHDAFLLVWLYGTGVAVVHGIVRTIRAVHCSDGRPRFYLGTFASKLFVFLRAR